MKISDKREWWQEVFDEKYLRTYIDFVTPEITTKQVSFLIRSLNLKRNQKILDLGCGYGRHSVELARRGLSVVGFDYSGYFLKIAKSTAREERLGVKFVQGNFAELPFSDNYFDVVISMFSSFGYFQKEKDNKKVLTNVYRVLKSSGLFLLDLNNPDRTIAGIKSLPNAHREQNKLLASVISNLSNGIRLKTDHQIDLSTMRWSMIRTWKEESGQKSYRTNLRLYNLREISEMLSDEKFLIERTYGDFEGGHFTNSSKRLIVLSRKG